LQNFRSRKNVHPVVQLYHAFHHALTTKNHVLQPVFSKIP
jgi:hypothetical protein